MGTHASATVFYGYDLGDMEDHETWESLAPLWLRPSDEESESQDPEARLAHLLGWSEAPFPSGAPDRSAYGYSRDGEERYREAYKQWQDTPEYQTWSASLSEKGRVIREEGPGVKFEWYGYLDGESTHYLAITESEQQIPDYGCAALDVVAMDGILASRETSGNWNDRLARYVELMELQPALRGATPGWHVAVKYG